jgi:hypothetical protein
VPALSAHILLRLSQETPSESRLDWKLGSAGSIYILTFFVDTRLTDAI